MAFNFNNTKKQALVVSPKAKDTLGFTKDINGNELKFPNASKKMSIKTSGKNFSVSTYFLSYFGMLETNTIKSNTTETRDVFEKAAWFKHADAEKDPSMEAFLVEWDKTNKKTAKVPNINYSAIKPNNEGRVEMIQYINKKGVEAYKTVHVDAPVYFTRVDDNTRTLITDELVEEVKATAEKYPKNKMYQLAVEKFFKYTHEGEENWYMKAKNTKSTDYYLENRTFAGTIVGYREDEKGRSLVPELFVVFTGAKQKYTKGVKVGVTGAFSVNTHPATADLLDVPVLGAELAAGKYNHGEIDWERIDSIFVPRYNESIGIQSEESDKADTFIFAVINHKYYKESKIKAEKAILGKANSAAPKVGKKLTSEVKSGGNW